MSRTRRIPTGSIHLTGIVPHALVRAVRSVGLPGLLSLCVMLSPAVAQPDTEVLEARKPAVAQAEQLPWLESLPQAYQQAQQHGKPIFLRLEGKSCPYCKVLDEEIQKTVAQNELKRWMLVRLDVDQSPAAAQQMAVGPIPALRLLTPTGLVIESKDGAMAAGDLVEWLQEHYEAAAVIPEKALLATGAPDALDVIRLVKLFKKRDATLREAAIQRLLPYPDAAAPLVVNAFSEGPLASQLSALELLREWKAPVEGLDPWNPNSLSLERLQKLTGWLEQIDDTQETLVRKKLTPVELNSCSKMIDTMLTTTPEEARAVRERLARYGRLLLPEVTARLKSVETDQARERLTALRYRLVAPDRLVLEWPGGIDRLAATDVTVRHKAIDELSKRATSQEEELLLELFSDPAPLVREISLRTLTTVGGTSARKSLIQLLNDPEPNVRAAVLKQLAEKPSASIVPSIATYVEQEKDPDLVVHAVRFFREAKGNASAEALVKLFSHSSWRVRAEAAEAITKVVGRYSPQKTLHADIFMALIKLLDDEDSFVVSRAVDALAEADLVVAVEPLAKVAARHPELATSVIKALSHGEKQRVKSIPYLREFCRHKEAEVRAAAITGLCELTPKEVKEELRELLADPESSVRTAAANALFEILRFEKNPASVVSVGSPFSDAITRKLNSALANKTGATGSDTQKEDEENAPKTQTEDVPNQQHTRDYENRLQSIREGKFRAAWMFELVPLLESMLTQESVDEQLAGARALIGLGKDQHTIPRIQAILKSHPEHISSIASVLPWLLWDDRVQLFEEMIQVAPAPSDLYETVRRMAGPRDYRAVNAFWKLLTRQDMDAALAFMIIRNFRQIYFGKSYYDFDDYSTSTKKRVAADMVPHIQSSVFWQRTVALAVLLSVSREEAEKISESLLSEKSTSEPLREVAFHVYLVAQTKTQARNSAIKGLSEKSPALRKIALAYLSMGTQAVSSVMNNKLALEFNNPEDSLSQKWGLPIIPEAPDGLDPQLLKPLLNSDDLQTAAYAGYLLTLLDDPDGLPVLLDYWSYSREKDLRWTRLVFRAIAYKNEISQVPLLTSIYEQQIKPLGYYKSMTKEFYWTIRIMTGPDILALRKRIRDEIGMHRLR
ncbi:HEAT repeat protein [Gimesia alba]|uniref:HEAT repeat protein n=1 Tax=Gimesia alba TaxID=2527973 RepID=A0A517RDK4_9PLAN|nr:HEAT repeat domain-containing protein [Gimesia alba]QDT41962.1 HEAT repeat protein [Gimesia alba]